MSSGGLSKDTLGVSHVYSEPVQVQAGAAGGQES